MFQQTLLDHLHKQLPENSSLIDAVATALEMSYDAAHRRVSLKSKFSIDECILLAKYYNLSIDRLFETTDKHIVSVEKTKQITNEADLENYFNTSYTSLQPLLSQKESQIIYSAKDIPLFYTIDDSILSRFKLYVWLKFLDSNLAHASFNDFVPSISLINSGKQLGSLYQDLNTIEIWDITTINSTLKQIHFYYSAGQLTTEIAAKLCHNLKILVNTILAKLLSNTSNFILYYNELLIMNNTVLVSTPKQQSLYVPFSILSYYQTSDMITCQQAETYLNKQLKNSKLLNTAGEKEQRTFFNKIFSKIDALDQLIKATQILDFE